MQHLFASSEQDRKQLAAMPFVPSSFLLLLVRHLLLEAMHLFLVASTQIFETFEECHVQLSA